jgi:hypothetical protein
MRTHFGIQLLWKWLTSKEAVDLYCNDDTIELEEDQAAPKTNIRDGNGVLLLRCWMEIMHIWMNYITRSPEHTIGEIDQFLFRMELQDAKANFPHVHAFVVD